LSGGRSGNNSPSSRRASHSVKVGNSMMVCSAVEGTNKRGPTKPQWDGPVGVPFLPFSVDLLPAILTRYPAIMVLKRG
jgi:hypothetical protein